MFKLDNLYLLSLSVFLGLSVVANANAAEVQNLRNVITVSEAGGDFTRLEEAIKSIGKTSNRNRYLILIGPGSFTVREPIKMKRWVSIKGSGKNVTQLRGATGANTRPGFSGHEPLFIGARDSNISDLEIKMGINSTNPSRVALEYRHESGCTNLENVAININASSGVYPTALSSGAIGCDFILDNVDISVSRSFGKPTAGLNVMFDSYVIRNSRIKATAAILSSENSFSVRNSHIFGQILVESDLDGADSGEFYDSVLQNSSELVAVYEPEGVMPTPGQVPSPKPRLSFIRSSFVTPNGEPEFVGSSIVCTLSDNGMGAVLSSNCEVAPQ